MSDEPHTLVPLVDEDSGPFWEATARGELRMQACGACGRLRFPPRPMCPWCRSTATDWPLMSGRGTLWSFVVPHPPLLPAYAALAPYNVVVVALEEDATLRLVGNLVASADGAVNEIDPATIEIDTPVRVVFPPPTGGLVMPRWVRG
ncbi:MAG: OB-fold domain-containing protein [Acidimicrobiia bacterium]|nr:OB-fold domain-containing protein [Acidimicrobiia bacterium]